MNKSIKTTLTIDELLFWAYQVQKADKVIDYGLGLNKLEQAAAGLEVRNVSGDGAYQVQRNGALGAQIDQGGYPSAVLHPDAEHVHDVLTSKHFSGNEKGYVFAYASTGFYTDPRADAVTSLVPDLKPNGKHKMHHDKRGRPSFCFLKVINSPEELQYARDSYSFLYRTLGKLGDRLRELDMLQDYIVDGVKLIKEPWLKNI